MRTTVQNWCASKYKYTGQKEFSMKTTVQKTSARSSTTGQKVKRRRDEYQFLTFLLRLLEQVFRIVSARFKMQPGRPHLQDGPTPPLRKPSSDRALETLHRQMLGCLFQITRLPLPRRRRGQESLHPPVGTKPAAEPPRARSSTPRLHQDDSTPVHLRKRRRRRDFDVRRKQILERPLYHHGFLTTTTTTT
jgi:hypothetical protein